MTNKPQTDQQPENVELLSAQAPITNFRGLMIAIVATIISVVLYQILPYDENVNKGLTILAFVAIMWFTEAVHITVTALIVPLFAILFQVPEMGTKQALAGFSDPIIYVFFGGFALATALHMQKLDRKIAIWLISLSRGNTFIAVHLLFAVTAFLSMWISNTAILIRKKTAIPSSSSSLASLIAPASAVWVPWSALHQTPSPPKP